MWEGFGVVEARLQLLGGGGGEGGGKVRVEVGHLGHWVRGTKVAG